MQDDTEVLVDEEVGESQEPEAEGGERGATPPAPAEGEPKEGEEGRQEKPKEQPKAEEETPVAEEPKPKTREEIAAEREKAIGDIASRYAFSKEDAEAIDEDPGKLKEILPKVAGRLFVEVYEAVYHQVIQQLPAHIGAYQTQSSGEEIFFQAHPELRSADREVIQSVAKAYMKKNPKATREQFIKSVGASVKALLGIEGKPPDAHAGTPKQKPYSPAKPGSVGPSPGSKAGPKGEVSVWDELIGLDLD